MAKVVGNQKFSWKKLWSKRRFKLGVLSTCGFSACALLPLVSLAGTHNDPYNTNYFHELSYSDYQNNQAYKKLPLVNVAYGKLVRGTNDFNHGNYVLYFGSERCPHCSQFLFNNPNFQYGTPPIGNNPTDAKWSSGEWGQGIQFANTNANLSAQHLKFVMFSDIPVNSLNKTNDDLWTFPWTKHQTDDLAKGYVAGSYVRSDKSAIEFREIFDFLQATYPNINGIPTVIAFKNGLPHILNPENKNKDQAQASQNQKDNKDNKDQKNETFKSFLYNVYAN